MREARGHCRLGSGQPIQETHFRIVQDCWTLIKKLHRAGSAVDPDDRPSLLLRKMDHIRGAAQTLAGFSVPQCQEHLTLLDRFYAAFVIALRQLLPCARDFHRQRFPEYAFHAGPCRLVKVFTKLFLREGQEHPNRQVQFDARFRKQ